MIRSRHLSDDLGYGPGCTRLFLGNEVASGCFSVPELDIALRRVAGVGSGLFSRLRPLERGNHQALRKDSPISGLDLIERFAVQFAIRPESFCQGLPRPRPASTGEKFCRAADLRE
ncbi:hypothetical protein H9L39_00507 [Fusarium oxysporum f. sp. albedinis]|nr:hypothetical protein H9L39_00507 [Fusarium oxysporum f. sp. albedinis]